MARGTGAGHDPERLVIVTGWGRSRSALQDGDLHWGVKDLLAELRVPTLPTKNQGMLLVDAQAWLGQEVHS